MRLVEQKKYSQIDHIDDPKLKIKIEYFITVFALQEVISSDQRDRVSATYIFIKELSDVLNYEIKNITLDPKSIFTARGLEDFSKRLHLEYLSLSWVIYEWHAEEKLEYISTLIERLRAGYEY